MSNLINYNISEDKLREIFTNAKNWNDVLKEFNLNTLTRKLQRLINKYDIDYSHLPKNFGGLYSKLSKNSKEFYINLVKNSVSWDDILIKLKYKTSFYIKAIKKIFDNYDINYSHLTYPKISCNNKKSSLEDILVKDSMYINTSSIKNKLIEELGWKQECLHCGKSTFSNKLISDIQIPIELDHINGDHTDNRIENLRFLCPICHALTPTYCASNNFKNIEKQNKINLINKKQEEILLLDNKINKDKNDLEYIESLKSELKKIMQIKIISERIRTPKENNNDKEKKPKEDNNDKVKKPKEDKKCLDCNIKISKKAVRCNDCNNKKKFTEAFKNIPSYEQLQEDLNKIKVLTKIGKKYNVSDNTIRKWLNKYKKLEETI